MSPMKSWNFIEPCVVLAVKSGAIDPRRSRGCSLVGVARCRRRSGWAGRAKWQVRERRGVVVERVRRRGAARGSIEAMIAVQ